jgi:hypothetical protein
VSGLRKFAASIGVLFVAFSPLLFASPAYAQTLEEAQTALVAGRQEVVDATLNRELADQTVANNLTELNSATTNAETAQSNYDTNLVPDPTWVHPTHEVEYTRLVPKTELVLKTVRVPTTTIVEHTTTTLVPGGLVAKSYNRQGYNNAPPLPTANETPLNTQNVPNINFQWGGGQVLNSGKSEDVLVAFEGNIMVPTDGWYSFYAPGDDGVKLTIAGMNLINDWYDKGGGGTTSEPMWIRAGILYPTTLYYYENGGGANVWLYYSTADTGATIVPPSWFGERTITETTYEEVTTWEDVSTWEEVTTWFYETYFVTELIPGAVAPLVKDEVLLAILLDKVSVKNIAQEKYNEAVALQAVAVSRELTANNAIAGLEQNVIDATPIVIPPVDPPIDPPVEPEPEPEPPVVPEPVEPEPEVPSITEVDPSTIDPSELTTEEVAELKAVAYETFETAEPGSEEYQEALEQLMVAAQADDIVVDEALAAIPLLGNLAVGLTDAFNFAGNIGADMSPKVRELAEKQVLVSVVAVGAAVQAAAGAATSAAAAASSSPSSRRK